MLIHAHAKTKTQSVSKKTRRNYKHFSKPESKGAKPSEEVKEVSATEEGEENKKEDKDLSKEELSFKKRYGDLRRHMASKDKETEERIKALEDQLSKATKNELVLPKSEDEIAEWTKKYPDVAGIVETIADKKARERSGELDKRVQDIEKMRVEATKEKAEAELMKLHPDFWIYVKTISSTIGQRNSLNGYRMPYMRMLMMLSLLHEL